MWITNLTGNKATAYQFISQVYLRFFLDFMRLLYQNVSQSDCLKNASLMETLGLESFKFFADYKMALFLFSLCFRRRLQLTNAYGDVFLDEFKHFPKYADSFVVEYSTIIMSISQISETLFILAIPFSQTFWYKASNVD
jgi:NHS family xanthosine MFS transporter